MNGKGEEGLDTCSGNSRMRLCTRSNVLLASVAKCASMYFVRSVLLIRKKKVAREDEKKGVEIAHTFN